MKKFPLSLVALLSLVTLAFAGSAIPGQDAKADALAKKIDADIKSGAISKTDGDELTHSLARIQKKDAETQRIGKINPTTQKTISKELDRLDKEVTRKEKQAAAAAASPSATP